MIKAEKELIAEMIMVIVDIKDQESFIISRDKFCKIIFTKYNINLDDMHTLINEARFINLKGIF